MANQTGQIRRPTALAVIKKNQLATMTQSKAIIPFLNFFPTNGSANIAPPGTWLVRK